ncbi:MAG: glycoside hydrolase family 130 protein, partial [Phycisphaerae bacterium]
VEQQLRDARDRYANRHKDLDSVFERHAKDAHKQLRHAYYNNEDEDGVPVVADLEESRRLLVGAYLTMEYSIESVALFNPSIVPHPDGNTDDGRFMLSLRACGEGHVSSIEFREGSIADDGTIHVDEPTDFAITERPQKHHQLDKNVFYLKLMDMGVYGTLAVQVLDRLASQFTYRDLQLELNDIKMANEERSSELAETMEWLARSSYHLEFPEDSAISERVIFPVTENESRGIEDARFVMYTGDDDQRRYYATYTAYNGIRTLPQILETKDFRSFSMHSLNGSCVRNKGLAFFPRKVGGRYMMLGRTDGENMYVLRSDNRLFWNESQCLYTPKYAWEFVQIGNCGSPIETAEGWLVLTHGVGFMREYAIGALLLDLEDPARVIGILDQPLITPDPDDRDGYVPNVVYSCGGMVVKDQLVIPYAVSDTYSRFATMPINDLLSSMKRM